MKYSYSDITQVVSEGKNIGKNMLELSTGCDRGYEYTLLQSYMEEVRQYCVDEDKLRVIIIVNSVFNARQAYLCLINKFIRRKNCANPMMNESSQDDYIEIYAEADKNITVIERVRVITDNYFKEIFETPPKEGNSLSLNNGVNSGFQSFKGGENLFFEVCRNYDADAIIDTILEQNSKCIGIMLKPGASCEYFIRRLTFEGEFDVIRVGMHSQTDYLDCANRYLNYHGFLLEKKDLNEAIEKLQIFRGNLFKETDIYTLLERGMSKAFQGKTKMISKSDLSLKWSFGTKTALEMMESLVGLEKAKETIKRLVAIKKVMTEHALNFERKSVIHTNLIFAGNPGTGKSELARLYAKMLAEIGISNGCFEDVSRADLIGKYVGHTAGKVRQVFERAQGGVIFVDEASFLLGDDSFVREAVVEFVRFMELYPETTVIFATYKKEAEQLLQVDAGFRSRISKVVIFEDYGQDELYQIMEVLSQNYGVKLEENCKIPMENYIEKIRDCAGFANGREVRKLLECAIEEYGLRKHSEKAEPILETDVSNAAKFLLEQRNIVSKKSIGFGG